MAVSLNNRSKKVYESIQNGICVECSAPIFSVSPLDPEYRGKSHVRCTECGWEAVFGQADFEV